jgi:hypothetical protein
MATKKSKNVPANGWPKIQQGTHLTVKTFEDGKTELIWDDEALLSEVRNAILKAESNISVSTEVKPVKKKAATKAEKVEEPKTKRKSKEK